MFGYETMRSIPTKMLRKIYPIPWWSYSIKLIGIVIELSINKR